MEQSLKFLYTRIKKPEYTKEQAESKVCQEIFIVKLGSSSYANKKVAFKGGLIIDSLAHGERGYTKDIDFDLIKYPLSSEGLNNFIDDLNKSNEFKNIVIKIEKEEELRHKNYKGKRLTLSFIDGTNKFTLVTDVGVYLPLFKQNIVHNYEIAFGGTTQILVNPIERIVAEKLSTFAIYGTDNERIKDLFDVYFFITKFIFDKKTMLKILNKILVTSNHYYKKLSQGLVVIVLTLKDESYIKEIKKSNRNWCNKSVDEIIETIISYLK